MISLRLLLLKLGFPFKVILCEVAVLAHTAGVVALVCVRTGVSHLGLASAVVAVVAHVLGVVLAVGVRATEDLSPLPLDRVGVLRLVSRDRLIRLVVGRVLLLLVSLGERGRNLRDLQCLPIIRTILFDHFIL